MASSKSRIYFLNRVLFLLLVTLVANLLNPVFSQRTKTKSQRTNSNLLGCHMEIIIDESLTNYFTNKYSNSDPIRVRQHIYAMVDDHIQFANSILQNHKFSIGIGNSKIVRLIANRIKILDSSSCNYNDVDYCESSTSNLEAYDFLVNHSKRNLNKFCLSYVFTKQNFEDGSLGLAWTASSERVDYGGVCTKFAVPETILRALDTDFSTLNNLEDDISAKYIDEITANPSEDGLSRNTGFVTFSHQGTIVPEIVSKLSFLHEIGHSLGSPHDFPSNCIENYVSKGHYIMHPSGVQRFLEGNYKFSTCSTSNISSALTALERFQRNCFTEVPPNVCGNGLLESWEECDCGEDYEDCGLDNCCYPANHPTSPCSLKPKAQCSPSEGRCCTDECTVVPADEKLVCAEDSDCRYSTTCDGSQARCPRQEYKGNSVACDGGSKLCMNGECLISICSKHNMAECNPAMSDHLNNSNPCEVHCQVPGRVSTCKPSSQLIFFSNPIYIPENSVCTTSSSEGNPGTFGHCDTYHNCISHVAYNQYSGYETPSVWVVGLVIFLLVYFLLMGLGVWFYCKYCKGKRIVDQRSDQRKICSDDVIADQRAITYNGEID